MSITQNDVASQHSHEAAPALRTYGYCSGLRHGRRKRVAVFSEEGLHQWCGSCHGEVVFTWQELDAIRAGLQRSP